MLYDTLPAAAAREGMLKPSGPLKNSGKIVTTFILTRTSGFVRGKIVHESQFFVYYDSSIMEIRADDDFRSIWNHHRSPRGLNVEHQTLRQLIECRHGTQLLAGRTDGAHADQIVEIDFAVLEGRQLAERRQQIAATP